MELVGFLHHAGSVARTGTLLQAGFTDRNIRNAVASGEVVRLRQGVLALQDAPADVTGAVMANGLLTCASAARHRQLWVLHEPPVLHLLCDHGGPRDAVVHRESLVPPDGRSRWPVPLTS